MPSRRGVGAHAGFPGAGVCFIKGKSTYSSEQQIAQFYPWSRGKPYTQLCTATKPNRLRKHCFLQPEGKLKFASKSNFSATPQLQSSELDEN